MEKLGIKQLKKLPKQNQQAYFVTPIQQLRSGGGVTNRCVNC